jgi:hypothetical protein
LTGADLAAILRVHARALGQNAFTMLETRADLRNLAQLLDPIDCNHEAHATTPLWSGKNKHRCLDCDTEWVTPQ